jgi:prophage antirepressor-like protein
MSNTSLQMFEYSGQQVRTVLTNGEPWFVASDVAKILGYRDSERMHRRIDPEDKGTRLVGTPGGEQVMTVISEPGLYVAVMGSQVKGAKQFKRWVTHEVLPQIRKTGSYGQSFDLDSLEGISQILDAGKAALNRAIEAEQRAEVAEARVDTIEKSDGYSIRAFHKQYFPDTPEREFFELLYKKRLLIDQRGARGRDAKGRLKNGKQHMHPAAAGKPYFHLATHIDKHTGARYHNTEVRPGTPETELIALLEKYGLKSNKSQTSLFKELT